jgi:cytidylate kinase
MTQGMLIAIDGPAGSGKSTVAAAVAEKLGLPYLDTGAMYRTFTLKVLRSGIPVESEDLLSELAEKTKIELSDGRVLLDGEDVTAEIRTPEVDASVSAIAAHAAVRSIMVRLQRAIAQTGAVVEGRDIGTVVLPDARLKVFLVATPEERARRRHAEISGRQLVDVEQVKREIIERDALDSNRKVSPLVPAKDAIVIDSTGRRVDEIVEQIISLLER